MNKRIKSDRTTKIVLGGIMIALSTVLSFIKIFQMPYGGSVTLCSMLPIMIFAYRYGIKWGLFCGLTHGVLQILFGVGDMKGLTLFVVVGSVIFDYLIGFSVLGFAGIFRKKIRNRSLSFTLGTLFSAFMRYLASVISGFIFFGNYAEWYFSQENFTFGAWALSRLQGFTLAFIYSCIYNISYMLPEMILTAIVAYFVVKFAGNYIFDDRILS